MASQIPTLDELLQTAVNAFHDHFGCLPNVAGCAPGRVNIIGEHTDYNEGFVLPMAITMVTIFVGKKNGKNSCSIVTLSQQADKPHIVQIDLNKKITPGSPKWANYVKGVLALFPGSIPGFDAVIVSSVPFRGGVGSSAALEVSAFTFLEDLTGQRTENLLQKVLICQKAEHEFAASQCGVMDQFVSVMGKKDCALLIDCRSMEATLIPFNSSKLRMIISNSNVKHEISSGDYPTRKKQCEIAAKLLSKKSLRDAKESDIKVLQDIGADKDIIKRAQHVIGENFRTEQAAHALEAGDFKTLGNLMIASHNSLRDNFQVSSKELDKLVQAALDVEGVYGARMMGAGGGGSTITLVKLNAVKNAIQHMRDRYNAIYYVATFMDGCQSLSSKLKDLKVTVKHLKSRSTRTKSTEEDNEVEQKLEQELKQNTGEQVMKSKINEPLKQKDSLQKSQEESNLKSTKQEVNKRLSKPPLTDKSRKAKSSDLTKPTTSKPTLLEPLVQPEDSKNSPEEIRKSKDTQPEEIRKSKDTQPEEIRKSKDLQPEEGTTVPTPQEQKSSSKQSNVPKPKHSKSVGTKGSITKPTPPGQDSNLRGSKQMQDAKSKVSKSILPEQKEKPNDIEGNLQEKQNDS